MTENASFNDQPIENPEADRYGIAPFAQALAKSIEKMQAPIGAVLAIHGAWGSGKSSAINLIRHYLREDKAEDKAEVEIVDFNCWWFRGEEALTLAFFRELAVTMGGALGKDGKKRLRKLAKFVLSLGPAAGKVLDLHGGAGVGAFLARIAGFFSSRFDDKGETVESLHKQITDELAEQNEKQSKRFLIVIDDIDRLSPDDALQMFRLVKSVGRLPNVIYLLAFDRTLAEKIVAEKYPAEGPHYLEKIIQAGFEIPPPKKWALRNGLRQRLVEICGEPKDADAVRFENVLNDVVLPEMRTPRDVVRLENMLSVTWPAVSDEVDLADFVALETLRLKQPAIHRAIRENKDIVCARARPSDRGLRDAQSPSIEEAFLGSITDKSEQERYGKALTRIFPLLQAGSGYLGSIEIAFAIKEWQRQRRACSDKHFDTYFRFAIGDDVLPKREIDEIIGKIRSGDQGYIREKLRAALKKSIYDGSTKARLILEEVRDRSDELSKTLLPTKADFVRTLFELADELDVEQDSQIYTDNFDRIFTLVWRLCESMDLETRSKVILASLKTSALGWRVYLLNAIKQNLAKAENNKTVKLIEVDQDTEQQMIAETLAKLREAAHDGTLGEKKRLCEVLYFWRDTTKDDGAEVRQWTEKQLRDDKMVIRFACAFAHVYYTQNADDAVGKHDRKLENPENLRTIIDLKKFRYRLNQLQGNRDIDDCLRAWQNQDREQ